MADFTLVTVTFEATTGIPEDRVVNTFAMGDNAGGSVVSGDRAGVVTAIDRFYNTIVVTPTTADGALSTALSPWLSRSVLPRVRFYDRDYDPAVPAGAPAANLPFTNLLNTPTGTPFPQEVATVLSLSSAQSLFPQEAPDDADPDSAPERPAARRRGRIYIGPLTTTASVAVGGAIGPVLQHREILTTGAERLFDELLALDVVWGVWSRQDQALHSLTEVYVDDAFDTQRRRGQQASVRTTVTVFP